MSDRYRLRTSDEIGASTHPYSFECPNYLCFWATAHSSIDDALAAIELHDKRCPVGDDNENIFVPDERDENGQPYTKPQIGKSLAEKLWDMLDVAVAEVIVRPSDAGKARGRALAEVVHLVCKPYYKTVDDVTRESVRRWRQKKGDVEYQNTPGYKYNPMPLSKYEAILAAKKPAPYDPKSVLTDDQKEAVSKGLQAGFTVDQLSKAYGVAPSVIEAFVEKPIEA
jgi:hypothetical protein